MIQIVEYMLSDNKMTIIKRSKSSGQKFLTVKEYHPKDLADKAKVGENSHVQCEILPLKTRSFSAV